MDYQPFAATLSAAQSYRLGDPILVTLEITNTGTETHQFLTWGTPLEDEVTDFLIVQRDGREVEYDGRLVKRGDPTDAEYVTLDPGQSLSRQVDISLSYPIDEPGDYAATLKITLHDAFAVPGKAKVAPRRRADHQPHALDPTAVQFRVVPDGQPRQTVGQAARQAEQLAKTSAKAKAPNFNGGTSAQQADTIVAHDNAQYFTALCASQLGSTAASTNALYQEWFGAFDQGRYDTLTKHYTDISNVLASEQVTYDLSGGGCGPSYFAWTNKGSRTVHLCNLYLSAAQIGRDCKFGTLVHEWSHGVSSTDDNAYGESACRNLAMTDPAKAANNADSHEYFAEHLAQSNFGKSCAVITDRSTFGRDEIDAMLPHGPAVIPNAFYVFVDGFWPDKLGITAASLSGTPNVQPTITVSPAVSGMTVTVTALEAEDPTLPVSPQRFTWLCQVTFTDDSGFPVTPGQVQVVTLTAQIAGLTGSAQIQLIREPNPYEIDGETWWLSTDLRVFQIRAGESRFGVTIGSTPADASAFIRQVLSNLNTGNSAGQTFDSISVDEQTSALELAQQVNNTNVFNFAIAKVRYRGTIDVVNVRVFFRLFQASTTSTDFDPMTTYRRASQGTTAIPLLGLTTSGAVVSIPCFAEGRVDSASASITTQADPTNVKTIPHDLGGGEAAVYFGCWLDINQTQLQFPPVPSPSDGPWPSGRQSVQQLVRGGHQCIVAEIAFDPDPIPAGVSPAASDKLAQRNLSIVESANPGDSASRRIPNTFELQPVATSAGAVETPDELLIDWGNTPRGSVATLYVPEIDAGQVVALADRRRGIRTLSQVDGETLSFPAAGLTYLPLPAGAASGLTGLLSVDLPDTVRKGEVYKVVVRQLTDAVGEPPIEIQIAEGGSGPAPEAAPGLLRWRQVVGSYQITIPVRTKERILPRETRLLAVLKWILQSLSVQDRWYPVFSRYVDMVADRVRDLGGDPDEVEPSPTGVPGRPPDDHERDLAFDGKVVGVIYDCFGDFEGFLVDDCGDEVRFCSREPEMESLVRHAWRERIAITVRARRSTPHRPSSIILRRLPARYL